MSSKLRIAHLGAGIFAKEAHAPVFIDLAKKGLVEVVLCWSRSQESSQQLAAIYADALGDGGPEVCFGEDQLDEVLGRDDFEAVTVVLPIFMAAEVSMKALLANKHVLSEKPIASKTEEAAEALRLWKEQRPSLHYCIAENYRFEAAFRAAQAQVKEVCEEILTVDLCAFVPFPEGSKYEKTQWRRESKHAGGVLLDSAVHFIAGLRFLVDEEATELVAMNSKRTTHLPQIDTFNTVIRFGDKFNASVSATYATSVRRFTLTVGGTAGQIVLDRAGGGYNVTCQRGNAAPETKFYGFCGVEEEIEAFVQLCLGSEPKDPKDIALLSASEGFADMAIVEAIVKGGHQQVTQCQFSSKG